MFNEIASRLFDIQEEQRKLNARHEKESRAFLRLFRERGFHKLYKTFYKSMYKITRSLGLRFGGTPVIRMSRGQAIDVRAVTLGDTNEIIGVLVQDRERGRLPVEPDVYFPLEALRDLASMEKYLNESVEEARTRAFYTGEV